MTSTVKAKIINFVWFQTIWFLAILFQYEYLWLIVALLVCHFLLSATPKIDGIMGLGVALYGSLIDGVFHALNFYAFSAPILWVIPLWLVSLWIAFIWMLRVSLDYLKGRYWLSAVLGAISGPLSYWAGVRFGAVAFPQADALTLGLIAGAWAVTVPLWLWLDNKITTHFDEEATTESPR